MARSFFDSDVPKCGESSCVIEVPDLEEGQEYHLTSYTHAVSRSDRIAKFLETSTFGPTMGQITAWPISSNLEATFASWIVEQMDEEVTGVSSLRAYFRRRLNPSVRVFAKVDIESFAVD